MANEQFVTTEHAIITELDVAKEKFVAIEQAVVKEHDARCVEGGGCE